MTEVGERGAALVSRAFDVIMGVYLRATKGSLLYGSLRKLVKLLLAVSPRVRVEVVLQLVKYSNHPVA